MKQLVHDIHPKPNIEEPRWDQSTYWNRARHFFITTNPLNLFCTDKQLRESKRIVENYRKGEFNDQLTLDELWRAKQIYDSTFHPDTKEKMFIVGRMSAQVPANMVITGMMMTFYKGYEAFLTNGFPPSAYRKLDSLRKQPEHFHLTNSHLSCHFSPSPTVFYTLKMEEGWFGKLRDTPANKDFLLALLYCMQQEIAVKKVLFLVHYITFPIAVISLIIDALYINGGGRRTERSTPAVVFWQWFNQSFNALVNYTNRSGDSPIPVSQLAWSYVGATGGALITALGLNSLVKTAHPLVGRFVPLCAVAAANCINIPLMRFRELQYGVSLFDSNGTKVGQSTVAAQRAIAMVTLSRILMAVPGMTIPPFFINWLERKRWYKSYRFMNAPIQVLMVGIFLTFATPLCCALFPQKSSIAVSELEPSLRERISRLPHHPELLYFNKDIDVTRETRSCKDHIDSLSA